MRGGEGGGGGGERENLHKIALDCVCVFVC